MDKLAAFARLIDALNDRVGRAVSWLTLAMVLITFFVAVMRYGFNWGLVWIQETYVWMHGVVFMMGAGYTLLHNAHVRVDVIYRPAGPTYKALVDLFGSLVLLLPMMAAVLWWSFPYVLESWRKLEESREAGGLPGLFLLKTVLLLFAVLVALQGLALAARALLVLRGAGDERGRGGEV